MEKIDEFVVSGPKVFSSRNQSILIVDDSPDMLELGRAILEMDGYQVFTAPGGEEALALLAKTDQPDLILLDMRMEGESGLDFLIELEKKRPDIVQRVPIVFLTAMDQVPASKASGWIRKPIDFDQFLQSIQRFINRKNLAPTRH